MLQERQPSRSSFEQGVTKLNSKQILARGDIVAVAVIIPGGWLYWLITMIADNRPTSFFYLALARAGLLGGKLWLNQVTPGAISNLPTFRWAFAGTYFIPRLRL